MPKRAPLPDLVQQLLMGRTRNKFLSINDSGELDDAWLTNASIALFFGIAYPRKSRFERRGTRRARRESMAFLSPRRSAR